MKILVRAHTNILEPHTKEEILGENLFGHNPGNWLFLYSVLRTLMTEDTEFGFINGYAENLDFDNYKYINETYDVFVMPLANVFKDDWIGKLKSLTYIVEHLTIPCVVIGCGVQAEVGEEEFKFHFNSHARKFMKAVLKKSGIVGIRGEVTAKYLEKLGFERDKDFTIIGCPSMFTFGINPPEITKSAQLKAVSINTNPDITLKNYNNFIRRSFEKLEESGCDYAYIPQRLDELRFIEYGTPLAPKVIERVDDYYPKTMDNPIYGHEIAFTTLDAWREYASNMDFTIGSRIHGCVMSALSGTPCLIIAKDTRVLELAKYHEIPYILMDDITEDTDLWKLYDSIDVAAINRNHKERFIHFLDFLEKNGLHHIYEEDINRRECPFDKCMNFSSENITPVITRDKDEQIEQMRSYIAHVDSFATRQQNAFRKNLLKQYILLEEKLAAIKDKEKQIDNLNKKINNQKAEISNKEKEIKAKQKELDQLNDKLTETRNSMNKYKSELGKYKGLKYSIKHVFVLLKGKFVKR